MIRTYKLVWGLLTPQERRRFILLIFMTMLMAIFEVIGVAGILPFLSVLANPEVVDTNPYLIRFAEVLGLDGRQQVTIALGLCVFVIVVLSMAIRALVTYAQIRFSLMRAYAIAARMLRGYLAQDYVWFLSRNSSDLGQSLLSEVDIVIRESVLPAVLIISNFLTIFFIGSLLFIVEPSVALGATGLLTSVYLIIYFALRKKLGVLGRSRVEANKGRFRVVQEITGGLKELKVMGLESQSMTRFREPAQRMARFQTLNLVMQRLPRYALEAATYGGFIVMVLLMIVFRGDEISDLLPLLGLLGMSATKLFPALQQMFQQLSAIRFSSAALVRLHENHVAMAPQQERADAMLQDHSDVAPLRLQKALELRDLRFRYPGTDHDTLNGFSATIPAATTLGIVGGTGAGKTTIIDLILGLLQPDAGNIIVDGTTVTPERTRVWQKSIGYVPQHIFLTDDTVAANIGFGVLPEDLDQNAIETAARVANLHEFVMSELPDGYDTLVGERGVRLSGGQRQRIGIARALYHNPDVLILDEATSALDNLTERAVMEAVHALGGEKTVIMIAHRLKTVENCDTIFFLQKGQLAASGTYQDLIESNEHFRRLATT